MNQLNAAICEAIRNIPSPPDLNYWDNKRFQDEVTQWFDFFYLDPVLPFKARYISETSVIVGHDSGMGNIDVYSRPRREGE